MFRTLPSRIWQPRSIAWLGAGLLLGIAATCVETAFAQQAPPADSSEAIRNDNLPDVAVINRYCASCHSEKAKTGGLVLEHADLTHVADRAEVWEKVVRKLRGGMMPPPGMPRPDQPAAERFTAALENQLDRGYAANMNPGRVGIHRLNRAEYANAVRDLLTLDIDVSELLPADDSNFGFDNIADALTVSPVLLERYLSASWKISGMAVGDSKISPSTKTYRVRPDLSQDAHVDGLPIGTRGGILAHHYFPLDGEYVFKVKLWGNTVNTLRGLELENRIEVTLDGQRIRLATFGGQDDADFGNVNPTASAEQIAKRVEIRVPIKAGQHDVGVAFLYKSAAPSVSLLQPFDREKNDPISTAGIPELDWVSISGPFNPTGPGDTASRRAIFICRPNGNADAVPCARKILSNIARRAYRKPVTDAEMEGLLNFYQRGRNQGGSDPQRAFDAGIEMALASILVNPQFLFRTEADPESIAAGAAYRISDIELASRLSFFLWSSIPDEPLLALATQGKLHDPATLEAQVRRMLKDPKASALVENFAGQWLYLRNLKGTVPDQQVFPDFDDNLRRAFQRETELFIGSVIHEDRNITDLLTADYTFLNERLARHYGIPGIYGEQFRRVKITDDARRGLLGQGSVLTVSSYGNRTSPVLRGKWIMTNLLGTPPPPPPPNVPALKEMATGTMRQRMEQHRANAACASCHRVMDPLGFSMENFDGIGRWRTHDGGSDIDASGTFTDGTALNGPVALRNAIAAKPEQFARALTEVMLTYALGRGVEYYDMPVIRGIARDASQNQYRFSSLVIGIVKSAPFQMRTKKDRETSIAQHNSAQNSR